MPWPHIDSIHCSDMFCEMASIIVSIDSNSASLISSTRVTYKSGATLARASCQSRAIPSCFPVLASLSLLSSSASSPALGHLVLHHPTSIPRWFPLFITQFLPWTIRLIFSRHQKSACLPVPNAPHISVYALLESCAVLLEADVAQTV